MYKIEDDVPLPGPEEKYPFEDLLKVGQSFLVPVAGDRDALISTRRSIGVSMGRAAKRLNREFEARAVEGGVRVWRVS